MQVGLEKLSDTWSGYLKINLIPEAIILLAIPSDNTKPIPQVSYILIDRMVAPVLTVSI